MIPVLFYHCLFHQPVQESDDCLRFHRTSLCIPRRAASFSWSVTQSTEGCTANLNKNTIREMNGKVREKTMLILDYLWQNCLVRGCKSCIEKKVAVIVLRRGLHHFKNLFRILTDKLSMMTLLLYSTLPFFYVRCDVRISIYRIIGHKLPVKGFIWRVGLEIPNCSNTDL